MKNNPASIGAKIMVETGSGKKITSFYCPSQGLCSSQTNAVMIGIGKEKTIKLITINFVNGKVKTFENPATNSTLNLNNEKI